MDAIDTNEVVSAPEEKIDEEALPKPGKMKDLPEPRPESRGSSETEKNRNTKQKTSDEDDSAWRKQIRNLKKMKKQRETIIAQANPSPVTRRVTRSCAKACPPLIAINDIGSPTTGEKKSTAEENVPSSHVPPATDTESLHSDLPRTLSPSSLSYTLDDDLDSTSVSITCADDQSGPKGNDDEVTTENEEAVSEFQVVPPNSPGKLQMAIDGEPVADANPLAMEKREEEAPLVPVDALPTTGEIDYEKSSLEVILTIEADLQAKVSDWSGELDGKEAEMKELKSRLESLETTAVVFDKNVDSQKSRLKTLKQDAKSMYVMLNAADTDIRALTEALGMARAEEMKAEIDSNQRALLAKRKLLSSLGSSNPSEIFRLAKERKYSEGNRLQVQVVDPELSSKRKRVDEMVDALQEAELRRLKLKDELKKVYQLVNQAKISSDETEAACKEARTRIESTVFQIDSMTQLVKGKTFELIELQEKLRTVTFRRKGKQLALKRQQWMDLNSNVTTGTLDSID